MADPHQLARRIGLNSAWYYDLEGGPERVSREISIGKLYELCRELHVPPSSLFKEEDEHPFIGSPEAFVELLKKHLTARSISIATFAEEIGWDLADAISDPNSLGDLNSDGFIAVCDALGLAWREILDEMMFAPGSAAARPR